MTKHRMHGTREYRAWLRMKSVCYNENHASYKTYGKRGIRVCPEWKDNFSQFYKDVGSAPLGCTGIEIIDINADYSKHNCRWINPRNRRELKDMPNQKNRSAVKRYKNPKRIVITVEQRYFEYLQRQAIEKSRQIGEPVSCPELIKKILEEQAPMPRQTEMFNKK